jgi:hypothetical protein
MSVKGFDMNSVTDTAKLFGMASDMGSRGQYFATWGGVGDYIGSAEQNDWLRDQMWRRFFCESLMRLSDYCSRRTFKEPEQRALTEGLIQEHLIVAE